MSTTIERGDEATRHERAIVSLTSRASASVDVVRRLFIAEHARLKTGARVHGYLQALTTAHVRSRLRRLMETG